MVNPRKFRAFLWNVTAGLTAEELWAQFRREARTSVAVYSAETGRNVPEDWSAPKARAGIVGSVIRAMFYRLSPARPDCSSQVRLPALSKILPGLQLKSRIFSCCAAWTLPAVRCCGFSAIGRCRLPVEPNGPGAAPPVEEPPLATTVVQ